MERISGVYIKKRIVPILLCKIFCGIGLACMIVNSGRPMKAAAQASEALQIVQAVNALRNEQGLEPYLIDDGLMAFAQAFAEYLASTQQCTHLRPDGSNPFMNGISENVASGDIGYITPLIAVSEIWADPVHMKTMTGHVTGWIGAGAAVSGNTVYYVLDVRAGEKGSSGPSVETTSAADLPARSVVPIHKATAQADGSVIHTVGYGQTLWGIAQAYGVQVDEIRKLNRLDMNAEHIYENQKLVIREKQDDTLNVENVKAEAKSIQDLSIREQPVGEGIPDKDALQTAPEFGSTLPKRELRSSILFYTGLALGSIGLVLMLIWIYLLCKKKI